MKRWVVGWLTQCKNWDCGKWRLMLSNVWLYKPVNDTTSIWIIGEDKHIIVDDLRGEALFMVKYIMLAIRRSCLECL